MGAQLMTVWVGLSVLARPVRGSLRNGDPSGTIRPVGRPIRSRATVECVEPVEINAGGYYLRMLRADGRVDDRPALLAAYGDPETARWIPEYHVRTLDEASEYISLRAREWRDGERCSWAVADPTSAEMLGEIGLKNVDFERGQAAVACWTHPEYRGRGIAAHAVAAALRFGFGGLGLVRIEYWYAEGNEASARVAAKCGFEPLGVIPGGTEVNGQPRDLLCFARSASRPAGSAADRHPVSSG